MRSLDRFTTETILTSPSAFGLVTATPAQRAISRALDGLPLGDLAKDAGVVEVFGGSEAVRLLPSRCVPPSEAHVLAAIRTAKSMLVGALIIRASQTVDVSGCSAGDVIRISVASLKLDGTRAIMGHVLQNVRTKPALRPLLVGKPDDATENYIQLRHPSGRVIEIVPVPLDRAGGSIVSFWSAGVIVDEEPRMIGAEDGVKNWDHMRDAAMGRLLPGAQFIGIGSPWAPFGPLYDLVTEHFGRPTKDMVIARGRGPTLNPSWWTPRRCAALERKNPTAYRTDVLGEFAEPESSLHTIAELEAVTRLAPLELSPMPGAKGADYVAALDTASRRNRWALVLVEVGDPVRVVLARWWQGSRAKPLSPQAVLKENAQILAAYGVKKALTDQWSVDAIIDLGSLAGLEIEERTTTAASKFEMHEGLRTMIASKQVELSPSTVLRRDLLALRKRVTQTSTTIEAARLSDGSHADLASALALAVDEARRLHVSGSRRVALPKFILEQTGHPRDFGSEPIGEPGWGRKFGF